METPSFQSVLPILLTTLLSSTIPLVAALFYTFNALNARIDARIEGVVQGFNARFQEFNTRLQKLENDLGSLRNEVADLKNDVHFLKGQLSTHFMPFPKAGPEST